MNGPGSAGEHPGRRRRADDTSRPRRIGRGDAHGRPAAPVHRNPELSGDESDAGASAEPGAGAPPDRRAASAELHGARTGGQGTADAAGDARSVLHSAVAYFRGNPQAFALLVICLVLGLGTFLAVLIALFTSGSVQTTGEPSGALLGAQALALF